MLMLAQLQGKTPDLKPPSRRDLHTPKGLRLRGQECRDLQGVRILGTPGLVLLTTQLQGKTKSFKHPSCQDLHKRRDLHKPRS
jgi:hypothetical protein